jgi:DNA replication protein DnaC
MPKPECPQCHGTGWRTVETRGERGASRQAVPCECSAATRAEAILERARIPRRYWDRNFDNYETDLPYDDAKATAWNRSLSQAKTLLQAFVREFPGGSQHGLLLIGPSGVGKTHLAIAALVELLKRGITGLYYEFHDLLKEIQASYDPLSQTSELQVLDPVLKTDVLLLDDLGAGKPSEWVRETVGHILNIRYSENRPSIITTNFLDRDSATPEVSLPSGRKIAITEDSLSDRIGARVRSRLFEMCRIIEIKAPDYRVEIKKAGHYRG